MPQATAALCVRLHAAEVPPLHLGEIDDAIAIQIQVLESDFNLLVVKIRTHLFHHSFKLFIVNGATPILVEFLKNFLEVSCVSLLLYRFEFC